MKSKRIRIKTLDVIILSLLALAGGYLAYRVSSQLNYKWDWGVIPQYLFRYDYDTEKWVPNLLMEGLFTTIRLSIWATLLAVAFGGIMGVFRVSDSLFKRMVSRTYVEIVRNMPPLVLVFIFFYFIGDQIIPTLGVDSLIRSRSEGVQDVVSFLFAPPARLSSFLAAVVTLALYEGAYIAEIFRGGIQSIEKGQWEAGYSLGLSWFQQMRFVILPQVIQRTLPQLAGQFISTIKDSAIVSVISVQELTFQGMQLMAATYLTFEVWITITALYLILTLGCSLIIRRLELHMGRSVA